MGMAYFFKDEAPAEQISITRTGERLRSSASLIIVKAKSITSTNPWKL
jgi:hypothetical protein